MEELAKQIRSLVADYARKKFEPTPFVPGKSPVPVSGKVLGEEELQNMVDSSLEAWLTTGRYNRDFEKRLAEFIGTRFVLTVNSGSSANLLAVATLCSHELGEKALKPGDEVITVAAGFPTTVNPLLLYGLVPVFVDIDVATHNIDPRRIESAITPKTRAIVIAHTLGNPFDLDTVMALAQKHGLWLIEDCCDALGSTYRGRSVGTFGHLATLSFYPAHHITMGEGGAVFTKDVQLRKIAESIRDWGRDCYCPPGKDNTCRKRFNWQLGTLPSGYDHKYIYSNLGFNLKISDMQAACALAQMDRLPGFVEARKRNFAFLSRNLASLEAHLILPQATSGSDPSWFGFLVTVRPESPLTRDGFVRFLDERKIGTRNLFGGNLCRQPYFMDRAYRVHGSLENTDLVMNRSFWIGVYPGLTEEMLQYVVDSMREYAQSAGKPA